MRRKLTRRKFLGASVAGALVLKTTSPDLAATFSGRARGPLTPGDQRTLRAAMDEIIPAGDGMPSASEAGGEAYLNRLATQDEPFCEQLKKSLSHLQQISSKQFGREFSRLPSDQRVSALRKLERTSPADFRALRDDVYESFYTQPRVWRLLGYEFYPTNSSGPYMKPFDESALAEVRKKPKHYREVS